MFEGCIFSLCGVVVVQIIPVFLSMLVSGQTAANMGVSLMGGMANGPPAPGQTRQPQQPLPHGTGAAQQQGAGQQPRGVPFNMPPFFMPNQAGPLKSQLQKSM